MSYFDDDLHPELVGAPFTYNFSALTSVSAVPIKFENELVGYFFHGSEEEPDSDGVLLKRGYDFQSEIGNYWRRQPKDSFADVEVRWESHATYRSLLDDYRNRRIIEDQFRDGFMNDPNPLPSRDKIWDMGHVATQKYSDLLKKYPSHEIGLEEFKSQFNDSQNYKVENPLRNRSHVDETGPDLIEEEF